MRDGLTRLLEAHGLEVVAAVDNPTARAQRPSLPVLVLSQYVEQLYGVVRWPG